MKLFCTLIALFAAFSLFAHKGEHLVLENIEVTTLGSNVTYAFEIKNMTGMTYSGVRIEFLKNGISIDAHQFSMLDGKKGSNKDEFTFKADQIDRKIDLIQIEITQIFNESHDWGGWDCENTLKQANTPFSEFYVDAPWRMKRTDESSNDVPIPLHFFLHDADQIEAFTLKIDYVNIRIKSASSASFGNILTYNSLPTNTFNSMFSCPSLFDGAMEVKQFDVNALSNTSSYTFDFDAENDFFDDYVSVDDAYWYFTFNIPESDISALEDIIDIEVSIAYANTAITDLDVMRMRVFRSDTDIPSQPNYFRGDTHLHSIYTQNETELGLPLCSTKEASKLIGLDWITTTDHTSDFDNYGSGNVNSNWAHIQNEVIAQNASDPSLIFIAGQEVAVRNSDSKLVHMLAYPSFTSPTVFPFLGDGNGDLIETNVTIDNVIAQLSSVNGFSFCAHPFATEDELPEVPVNGGIWNLGDAGFPSNGSSFPSTGGNVICNNLVLASDILDPASDKLVKDAIKGSQIWNARPNIDLIGSTGNDLDPFEGTELDPWDVINTGTSMAQMDTAATNFHLKRMKQGQEIVNHINQLGLAAKNENDAIQNWKMYYSGGSDAHGSFNFSNTDNFAGEGNIDNNAVGKVNTIAYCPNGMGTNGSEVLKALYNGHISMSDGPILSMGISEDGDNLSNEILMGNDAILYVDDQEDIHVNFNYTTTPEFGDFVMLTFVIGSASGEIQETLTLANTTGNVEESYHLMSLMEMTFGMEGMPLDEYLYVRAELETFVDYSSQESLYRADHDYFHSYTNPVWIKWDSTVWVEGCTASDACNFEGEANVDDNSCYFIGDPCDDSNSETENDVYTSDCICEGDEIILVTGCIDVLACNYLEEAEIDDGSCVYLEVYNIIGNVEVEEMTQEVYTYTNTVGSTYTWTVEDGAILNGQGTNTIEVFWTDLGLNVIQIIETDAEGCSSAPVTLEVNVGVTAISNEGRNAMQFYPNPASDILVLDPGSFSGVFNVEVFNLLGQIVYTSQESSKSTVSISNWARGTYTVRMSSKTSVQVGTLVIE